MSCWVGDTDIFYFNFQCQVKLVFWTEFIFLQHCLPVVVISIADSNEMNKQLFFLFNFLSRFIFKLYHTHLQWFSITHTSYLSCLFSLKTHSHLCFVFVSQIKSESAALRGGRGGAFSVFSVPVKSGIKLFRKSTFKMIN